MQDNGIFSKISPLEDHCLQRNGEWRADNNHIWITLEDETTKLSYTLIGETLSIANGETSKKMNRSDKSSFELMMLAGHCVRNEGP